MAQEPSTRPWRANTGGPRDISEVRAIAEGQGIEIDDEIRFVVDDTLNEKPVFAMYCEFFGHQHLAWEDFLDDEGFLNVRLRRDVLDSDEAIVAVVAHEMFEINGLRPLFAAAPGRTMTTMRLLGLVCGGRAGNLHCQAWDFSNETVDEMRERRDVGP